jgi:hypothetical protein
MRPAESVRIPSLLKEKENDNTLFQLLYAANRDFLTRPFLKTKKSATHNAGLI